MEACKFQVEPLYLKYVNLFDFAPIGYLIIDEAEIIREVNFAAAVMFNHSRGVLIGRRIIDFIHRDDHDGFYINKRKLQKKESESITFELKMLTTDHAFFNARLQMQSLGHQSGHGGQFTLALTDVSEATQLSSSLALAQTCLELACRAETMKSLLEEFVKVVKAYLQCDAVGIRIRDGDGNIPYQAYDGFSQAFIASESPLSLHADQCLCITVIKGRADPGHLYFTPKGSFYINGTTRFLSTVPKEELGPTRNICNAHGYESVALIPIVIDHTIKGLIHVADHRESHFALRVVENLEAVASRLGLALQRLHLQEQLRRSVETLNDLSSHLLTIQEDEQRRIAMELHDGCGQDLNVLKLRLKNLQTRLPTDRTDLIDACGGLLADTDKIINDIRDITHGLKPAVLDALGLAVAVKQMIREFSTYTKIQVEAHIDLLDRIKETTAQTCLYRIFQEALTNIHKHAQATWVLMQVSRQGENIQIKIKDNGIGFDVQKTTGSGRKGLGLQALALRCRMIGADFSIKSEAGRGTGMTICLSCPDNS